MCFRVNAAQTNSVDPIGNFYLMVAGFSIASPVNSSGWPEKLQ